MPQINYGPPSDSTEYTRAEFFLKQFQDETRKNLAELFDDPNHKNTSETALIVCSEMIRQYMIHRIKTNSGHY